MNERGQHTVSSDVVMRLCSSVVTVVSVSGEIPALTVILRGLILIAVCLLLVASFILASGMFCPREEQGRPTFLALEGVQQAKMAQQSSTKLSATTIGNG